LACSVGFAPLVESIGQRRSGGQQESQGAERPPAEAAGDRAQPSAVGAAAEGGHHGGDKDELPADEEGPS
jgi:hypothetical protein